VKYSPIALVIASVIASAGTAPAVEPLKRSHRITVDDYFALATITEVALSPDGSAAAYIEQRWEPPSETRNSDLWVVEVATGATRRLTFDRAIEAAPRWSSDGAFVYYTADSRRPGDDHPPFDGSTQVWRVSPAGGEQQAVTRVEGGIGHFALAGDGSSLFFSTTETEVDGPWKDLLELYPDLEYGHGVTPFNAVQKLNLTSWRMTEVVPAVRVIRALAVAPTTGRIAMVTTPDDEQIHAEGWSEVHVFDPASGETVNLTPESWRHTHPSPYGWVNNVCWSADGNALAYSVDFDGYPTLIYTTEWVAGDPTISLVGRPAEISAKEGVLAWRGAGRDLAFIGHQKARSRVYVLEGLSDGTSEKLTVLTPGDTAVTAFSLNTTGTTAAVITATTTDPPDIYVVLSSGKQHRITHVNPQVETWLLPQIEIVAWTSGDGTPVEGILELPPDYRPSDGPLPMIVEIHGGPTSATRLELQYWIYGRTLMAANGYALLSPNYRGSIGYGDSFLTDLIGHENDLDVDDILTGVDAMVERGIADRDRLGVMGWSNGGFLTNCLITRGGRFKAASSGAGVLDQNIQWATQDTPGHNINFMNGVLPWQDPEAYRKASPLDGLGAVATPTLIHVGGDDPRVPPAHSRALYRALRQYLGVPTELVVYPGEKHSLQSYLHRKAKMEWDLAWFSHYLAPQEKTSLN
jgi:dipeptidyl aminopeptidase/acylaminoacyl peptidase